MGQHILCKDCKYLIWYKWWWPYIMGSVEVEAREECDHPKNHEISHNAVTGERYIGDCKRSPQLINKNMDCGWFRPGKHKDNYGGEMSPADRESYRKHEILMSAPRRWWPFW
jgi:hypothetical protein